MEFVRVYRLSFWKDLDESIVEQSLEEYIG